MDVFESHSTYDQRDEPPAEPMQVKLELLSPCKRLLVESRQLQTIADLLMEKSKQQIITAKRRITLLNLLRHRLGERSYTYRTFEQERQMYQQELTHLWEDFRASRRLRSEGEQPSHTEQQLRQKMEHLSDALASWHQRFASDRQALRKRLEALRNEHVFVRRLEDPLQRHQAYQLLREELSEAQELMREQQETYRILGREYQAMRAHLHVEKTVLDQRLGNR